jgi:hypothetical protein
MISLANYGWSGDFRQLAPLAGMGPFWLRPFLDCLLDGTYLTLLLVLLCYVSVVWLGVRLIREFPLRGPYFSSLFALTWCPYLCFCSIGLIKVMHLARHGRYIDNLPQQIEALPAYFLFGLANSTVALLLYSIVYAASRKRNAVLSVPQSA